MNEIKTLVVDITLANGETLQPIYECQSEAKFDEFVEWHEQNLSKGATATLKGYTYNNSVPLAVVTIHK
jgi:tRNA U34 2-thiouridine synthase MnmA/TrmU